MDSARKSLLIIFIVVLSATIFLIFLYFSSQKTSFPNSPNRILDLVKLPTANQVLKITNPNENSNIKFENAKDSRYKITVKNITPINNLSDKWLVFNGRTYTKINLLFSSSPIPERDIQSGVLQNVFKGEIPRYGDLTVRDIQDLISSSAIRNKDDSDTLDIIIYISQSWINSPTPLVNPIINNKNVKDNVDELLNYQFVSLLYWIGAARNELNNLPQGGVEEPIWQKTIKVEIDTWKSQPGGFPLKLEEI